MTNSLVSTLQSPAPLSRFTEQTLLFDADDTLWENNIFFERAIADFISYLNHHTYSPAEVRHVLNQVEHETILAHGYGLHSFRGSLIRCFERLSTASISSEERSRKHDEIHRFADSIASADIQLLPGVAETLPILASRHRLLLVTKGNVVEQTDKLERSGLKSWFTAVEIPAEKNRDAYLSILDKYALPAMDTWMIGNSPKSDVNPALAAGMHAVLIPHEHTWVLEHDNIPEAGPAGQHFLRLDGFGDLTRHF